MTATACGSLFHAQQLFFAGRCVCGDFLRICCGCLRSMLNPSPDRVLCDDCLGEQAIAELRERLYARSGFRPIHPRRDNPFQCWCGATARQPYCRCDDCRIVASIQQIVDDLEQGRDANRKASEQYAEHVQAMINALLAKKRVAK